MIHNGDKFFATDLLRSIDELRGHTVVKYLDPRSKKILIPGPDNTIYNLPELTPDQYAFNATSMYDPESSAIALDKQLHRNGYRTTYRFAHKYNTFGIDPQRIVHDAYRLEYFYQNFITSDKYDMSRHNRVAFIQDCDDAARVSYYYAQYIWALNPDARFDYAQRLNMYEDWGLILRFLLGTAFNFAPRDVYYFVTEHSYRGNDADKQHTKSTNQQLKFKNWCMDKYGIDTGCLVLHPDSQEKLRRILTRTDTPYATQVVMQILNKILHPFQR